MTNPETDKNTLIGLEELIDSDAELIQSLHNELNRKELMLNYWQEISLNLLKLAQRYDRSNKKLIQMLKICSQHVPRGTREQIEQLVEEEQEDDSQDG